MAQLASALAWGARGRLFESDHPDEEGQVYCSSFNLMHMYYTYILFSAKINRFYTGQTQDLYRRIEEHNRGKSPGKAKGTPWKLMYSEVFDTRAGAMKLEKFIKKRGAARFLNDHNSRSVLASSLPQT